MKVDPIEGTAPSFHGFLLVDKPEGLTSSTVVAMVKRRFRLKKIGHTGTLDPFATGLMILSIGHGTKLSEVFLKCHKVYDGTIAFGRSTTSGDRDGDLLEEGPLPLLENLRVHREKFIGVQMQMPPMVSAIKKNGVPLYRLARKGVEVERDPREIEIRELDILSSKEKEGRVESLAFRVASSGGTYVRTLAEDWARAAESLAYLKTLRRTKVRQFSLENALPLEKIVTSQWEDLKTKPCCLSLLDHRLDFIDKVEITEEDASALRRGRQDPLLPLSRMLPSQQDHPLVLFRENSPVAYLDWRDQRLVLRRVFMA